MRSVPGFLAQVGSDHGEQRMAELADGAGAGPRRQARWATTRPACAPPRDPCSNGSNLVWPRPPLSSPATAGDNTLVVNAAGPDSGSYSLNGGPAVLFTNASSFTFNGGTGSNTMTVNNPSGGLFAPSGGVFFNGGGNGNTNSLTVQGGAAVTEVFNFAPVSIGYPLR